jgi:hypothetical protein
MRRSRDHQPGERASCLVVCSPQCIPLPKSWQGGSYNPPTAIAEGKAMSFAVARPSDSQHLVKLRTSIRKNISSLLSSLHSLSSLFYPSLLLAATSLCEMFHTTSRRLASRQGVGRLYSRRAALGVTSVFDGRKKSAQRVSDISSHAET